MAVAVALAGGVATGALTADGEPAELIRSS